MTETIDDLRQIYAKLADEESRDIFKNRLLYNVTDELLYMEQIVRHVPEFQKDGLYDQDEFERFIETLSSVANGRAVVIYGAGWNGKIIFESLKDETVACFCDRKAQAGVYTYCGKTVLTVEEAVRRYQDAVFVISAVGYQKEIVESLTINKVKEENIVRISSNAYIGCSLRQYFDTDIMKPGADEVFVDCGCYDCDSIKRFKEWCGHTDKMTYAFEADCNNFELCGQIIKQEQLHRVKLFHNAVWSSGSELTFRAFDNAPSANCISQDGTVTVKGIRLDDALDIPPTFIKMDVEGAELEALKGAAQTIKRYHPKLVICIYHRPEDIMVIPNYIHSLDESYQFYIRHYGNWLMDTVLYAV